MGGCREVLAGQSRRSYLRTRAYEGMAKMSIPQRRCRRKGTWIIVIVPVNVDACFFSWHCTSVLHPSYFMAQLEMSSSTANVKEIDDGVR